MLILFLYYRGVGLPCVIGKILKNAPSNKLFMRPMICIPRLGHLGSSIVPKLWSKSAKNVSECVRKECEENTPASVLFTLQQQQAHDSPQHAFVFYHHHRVVGERLTTGDHLENPPWWLQSSYHRLPLVDSADGPLFDKPRPSRPRGCYGKTRPRDRCPPLHKRSP